jgi:hypothetical protein
MAADKTSPKTLTFTDQMKAAAFTQAMLARPGWCKDLADMGVACSLLAKQFAIKPIEDSTWMSAEFTCELTDAERAVIRKCIRHFISEGAIGPHADLMNLFHELSILKD